MPKIDEEEIKRVYIQADLLYSEAEVEQAINKLAALVTEDMADKTPVVFPVLNGGLVVGGKLLTKLNFPLEAGYLHATRYRNTTSGHSLEWLMKPQIDVKGRAVLIVDDIFDEGITLTEIVNYCHAEGASEVKVAVLVHKNHNRTPTATPALQADFIGLEIEDRYVFGYGMDYKGYWRNAPGIFAVRERDR
ncbi:MAG: hypoxanthine phosphoribosyltransferase [Neptuniibacter pectenicola]|jgi:hypoxanthine phosphoribosyltransferase|uniref:hypoxanthine-guanine phosphoribosyltransferase n=1 Tax=Neptuniibacter pectenicola TaxID=1806669 RepID=UPI000798A1D8|nr:MAG: hypoxanthine-guanine phosphoribosyltransferase [Neptuniibacter sp. Phe_28]|tara:strand:+ start:2118 stop:2690 length:573 start_codon:yes stop_codon:yes gene_type:complete